MCTQKEHIPLQSQCIDVHVHVKKKNNKKNKNKNKKHFTNYMYVIG